MQGYDGFPTLYGAGTDGDFNYMAIEMLGPSLEDLYNYCGRQFSLKTVLMLADQAIKRLEVLHNSSIIHRDQKPDNYLIGSQSYMNTLFLIDFGLAKRYRNPRTHQHIAPIQHKSLTGTARYASINAHYGLEQSRRDDLEALGYILIYLLMGGLPWQNVKCKEKTKKYRKIMEAKLETNMEVLLNGYPREFIDYMEYVRNLQFEDKPDYRLLTSMFKDLFLRNGFQEDFVFDWNLMQVTIIPLVHQYKQQKINLKQVKGHSRHEDHTDKQSNGQKKSRHDKKEKHEHKQPNPQTADMADDAKPPRNTRHKSFKARRVVPEEVKEEQKKLCKSVMEKNKDDDEVDSEELKDNVSMGKDDHLIIHRGNNNQEFDVEQIKDYLIANGYAKAEFDNMSSMFANALSNRKSMISVMNSPASAFLRKRSHLDRAKLKRETSLSPDLSNIKRDISHQHIKITIGVLECQKDVEAVKDSVIKSNPPIQHPHSMKQMNIKDEIIKRDVVLQLPVRQPRERQERKVSIIKSECSLDRMSDEEFDEYIENIDSSRDGKLIHFKSITKDLEKRESKYKESVFFNQQ